MHNRFDFVSISVNEYGKYPASIATAQNDTAPVRPRSQLNPSLSTKQQHKITKQTENNR